MKPGPKRKPTRLKVLHGSHETGLKEQEAQEPKPRPVIPPMPDDLVGEEVQLWERLTTALHRLGLMTEVDGEILALYVHAWAEDRRCRRKLRRVGRVMVTPSGYRQQRPEVSMMKGAQETMLRCAEHFGFSPAARARLTGGGSTGQPLSQGDLSLGGLLDF